MVLRGPRKSRYAEERTDVGSLPVFSATSAGFLRGLGGSSFAFFCDRLIRRADENEEWGDRIL